MKKLIVFDLDGTLAESKQAIDADMSRLFAGLLAILPVCVISGGDWPQFERQLLGQLPTGTGLNNLFLLPTSDTKFYRFDEVWVRAYADTLTAEEHQRIMDALHSAIADAGFSNDRIWGDRIEDRGTQITFSGLGQQAPSEAKAAWDPDRQKRSQLKALLDKRLSDFAVRIGGSTSIDITRPGIDKAYGVRKLSEQTGIGLPDMLFVGDALYPGGNDAPVRDAGVATVGVRTIGDTKLLIDTLIKFYG